MPQLLIKLVDHIHPDPSADQRGSYKRGMVVAVVDDAHQWGMMEDKREWIAAGNNPNQWHGKTGILQLTGIDKASIADLTSEELTVPALDNPIIRRRSWSINLDNLPMPFKNQILTDGYTSVPLSSMIGLGLVRRISDSAEHPAFV